MSTLNKIQNQFYFHTEINITLKEKNTQQQQQQPLPHWQKKASYFRHRAIKYILIMNMNLCDHESCTLSVEYSSNQFIENMRKQHGPH